MFDIHSVIQLKSAPAHDVFYVILMLMAFLRASRTAWLD